ncbi:MAG: FecR domain-containing protein [Nitrospira sp.]|nr:FecR domain-containing protein [Nitrospira sp.]
MSGFSPFLRLKYQMDIPKALKVKETEERGAEQSGSDGRSSAAEEALHWFVRLKAGYITDGDRAQFQVWCDGQVFRRDEFDKLTEIWDDLDDIGPLLEREVDRADAKSQSTGRRFSVRPQGRRSSYGFSAALVASLLAVVAGGWWFVDRAEIADYRTARGEQRTVVLPDGTRMVLNTETAVTTEMSMFKRTVVLHQGEALFIVTHDDRKPFRVEAGSRTVRDIGTQFTVRRDHTQVTVSVVEGVVEVQSSNEAASAKQQTTLTAGERASYSEQGGLSSITTVDVAAVMAWTTGDIVFDQRPLAEVVQEFGRYHRGEIRVLDPRLSDRKISGRFSLRDREAFLRAVKAATQAKSTHVGENVIILNE